MRFDRLGALHFLQYELEPIEFGTFRFGSFALRYRGSY